MYSALELSERTRLTLIIGIAARGCGHRRCRRQWLVGLIIPHILRPLPAHRPGALLLRITLAGSTGPAAADIRTRLILPNETPETGRPANVGAPPVPPPDSNAEGGHDPPQLDNGMFCGTRAVVSDVRRLRSMVERSLA
jgi:hypothetical protein